MDKMLTAMEEECEEGSEQVDMGATELGEEGEGGAGTTEQVEGERGVTEQGEEGGIGRLQVNDRGETINQREMGESALVEPASEEEDPDYGNLARESSTTSQKKQTVSIIVHMETFNVMLLLLLEQK